MYWKFAKVCSYWCLLAFLTAILSPQLSSTTLRSPRDGVSEEVSLQIIVVRTQEEARDVLDRLKKGEKFTKLVREKSIDPTAENGGFLGKLSPNALRPELREALKGVNPGQYSSIAQIPSGYAIVMIVPEDSNLPAKNVDPLRANAVSATGAIRYAPDVDGLVEAGTALSEFPKGFNWNADPNEVCELRKQSLASTIGLLSNLMGPVKPGADPVYSPIDLMQLHYGLGQLYAYEGNMDSAVDEYEASYRIALSGVQNAVPRMEEALGILYLHKSEMENGAYRTPGKKCLFPMRPEDAYKDPHDSLKAIDYLLKCLGREPDAVEVKWLLNVAYMSAGKYPAGVPEKYLIPPSTFESKEDVGRFEDVAVGIGLDSFTAAGGVVVDDFENNGLLDVITTSWESCGPMHYFHNNGDGTFTDQTEKAGLAGQKGGLNIMQTDYNNDGCLDLLVMRGAWEFAQRKTLLRNNCDGTFTDVTIASGLAKPTSSQAGVWADFNNDGLLDLFVANENGPAQLFRNNGDGTFKDIALTAGVSGDGSAFPKGVAAADYDNDGYVDLFVSNLNGRAFLYHNNHDGTFTEASVPAGVPSTGKGFATWFFDYDNDGLPDLFQTSYFPSVDETVRTYLGLPHNATTLKLYKNMGDGTFRDVTAASGLDKVFMPMGANFGDIDNDGYLDIYMGTGNPSYASIVPNVLLRNHDGKYFVDVTTSSGTGELHKGHAVAFADLRNSGNEDIVTVIGGATPGDAHALRVFRNPGHDNDWITVKLVGVKSNRPGIGAQIKVTVENGQGTRSIYRTVGSGGSFGSSPLRQHIGLGKSAKIQTLEVYWPVTKTRQVFHNVDKNQFVEIKEFSDQLTKLNLKPLGQPGLPAGEKTLGVEAKAKE